LGCVTAGQATGRIGPRRSLTMRRGFSGCDELLAWRPGRCLGRSSPHLQGKSSWVTSYQRDADRRRAAGQQIWNSYMCVCEEEATERKRVGGVFKLLVCGRMVSVTRPSPTFSEVPPRRLRTHANARARAFTASATSFIPSRSTLVLHVTVMGIENHNSTHPEQTREPHRPYQLRITNKVLGPAYRPSP